MFGSMKGGVGKTTLTLLTALYLKKLEKRVGIIDFDDSEASKFFVDYNGDEFLRMVDGDADGLDYILIDTAPRKKGLVEVSSYLSTCNRFILVSDTSDYAIRLGNETIDLLDEMGMKKKILGVFTNVQSGTKRSARLSRFKSIWADRIALAETDIPRATTIEEAVGLSGEWQDLSPTAKTYVGALVDEIISRL